VDNPFVLPTQQEHDFLHYGRYLRIQSVHTWRSMHDKLLPSVSIYKQSQFPISWSPAVLNWTRTF
jgi:hypothetical protein